MANDSAQERTEQATPRRRQQARKKGTVTRSADLTSAVGVVAILLALPMAVSNLGGSFVLGLNQSLSSIPMDVSNSTLSSFVWSALRPAAIALAPVVIAAMTAGLLANFAQVGFVLSGEAMSPSLSKINPLNGFKRLFSATAAMEAAKASVKSILFCWLAYMVLRDHWSELAGLSGLPPILAMSKVGSLVLSIFVRIVVAWIILAAIDYWFQRRQVEKQLRMTKEEVKQEMKEMEQSPELRGAIARRRHRLMKGRLGAAMKTADAVITNPTHYAVAIQYDPKKMYAPMVVAKGMDFLAQRIRELAVENKVPIVPNPPLARQLYKKCEVGDFVPRDLFQAVAEVLAYVYTTLKRVKPPA